MQWQTSRKMDALKDQTFKSLGTSPIPFQSDFRVDHRGHLVASTNNEQTTIMPLLGGHISFKIQEKTTPTTPTWPNTSYFVSPYLTYICRWCRTQKKHPPPRPRHVFRNGPSLWGRRVFVTPRRTAIRHQTIQWIPPFVKWKPTIWGLWLSRVTAICHPSKWWSGGWFMILGLPHPVGQKNRGGDFHI